MKLVGHTLCSLKTDSTSVYLILLHPHHSLGLISIMISSVQHAMSIWSRLPAIREGIQSWRQCHKCHSFPECTLKSWSGESRVNLVTISADIICSHLRRKTISVTQYTNLWQAIVLEKNSGKCCGVQTGRKCKPSVIMSAKTIFKLVSSFYQT